VIGKLFYKISIDFYILGFLLAAFQIYFLEDLYAFHQQPPLLKRWRGVADESFVILDRYCKVVISYIYVLA
jgi:hypothetical protein